MRAEDNKVQSKLASLGTEFRGRAECQISFMCLCGQNLTASEDLSGRMSRCPKCGDVIIVPARRSSEQREVARTPEPPGDEADSIPNPCAFGPICLCGEQLSESNSLDGEEPRCPKCGNVVVLPGEALSKNQRNTEASRSLNEPNSPSTFLSIGRFCFKAIIVLVIWGRHRHSLAATRITHPSWQPPGFIEPCPEPFFLGFAACRGVTSS